MSQIQELAHLQIPLQSIKLATDNFADQNFIGQGGFGRVYKGQIPHPITGQETAVAVKRLDVNNMITGQGQNEFLKEIVTLASYKHDNIVTLVGFCDEDDEKVLVYKHEVNGSLDKHLANKDLTWEQRLHICLDVARGLKYLHEDVGVGHRVIHRDMKSSNILLDENMKAKISDFGLCKIGPRSEQFSILVTKAAGTLGYVDPQYSETGVLTKESDVYALGIVLCEVLCGRFACIPTYGDRRTFLSLLVTHHYENRSIDRVIFPCLQKQMKPYSLDTFMRIAFDCMNKDRRHRPTMGTVLKELEAALEHPTVLKIGKRTMLWGSTSGGTLWTFMVNNNQKLTNITINYHSWIHSISFTKKDLDGELSCSQTHGGDSRRKGKIYEINFDDDEEIIGISGTIGTHHDHELVSSLCFVTNKREHGPFGTTANTGFSASWDVGLCVGFHGRCGWELDAIGCYLV